MRGQSLVVAAILRMGVALGAEVLPNLTSVSPGDFPPPRAVHARYRFGWEKLSAAEAAFASSKLPNGLLQLKATAHSKGAVRTLWPFDLEHSTWCDGLLRPQGFVQHEIYRRKSMKTDVTFGRRGLVAVRERAPPIDEPAIKSYQGSPAFDLYSAYLLIRSQSLHRGDEYRVLVFAGAHLYLAKLAVAGPDTIKVDHASRRAIRLSVALQRVTAQSKLEPYEKFKRATVWLSEDADRLPLKAEADIFVGTVWAELREASHSP